MAYRKDPIFQIDPASDFIYYDMNVLNLRNNNTKDNLHLQFRETRSVPILHNAEEYTLSVIRFFVSTYHLPVLFFPIEPNQADINKGVYTVTLEYRTVGSLVESKMVNVIYVPEDSNATIPAAPNTTTNGYQEESEYYYIHSYEYVLQLFNTALKTAYDQLKAQFPNDNVLKNGKPPFLSWDFSLNRPVIYARDLIYNTKTNNDPLIKVFFNRESWTLFNSFACLYNSNKDQFNRNYQLLFQDFSGTKLVVNDHNNGINRLIKMEAENDPTANWSPIASVMFTSNTIPVVPNYISLPKLYDNGQLISLTNAGNNFLNMISDIVTDEGSYRPHLLYVPQGENRRIDLKNNNPLQELDISVYYRTKTNGIYPLVLPAGGSASIKLLFERKQKYRS